MPNTVLRERGRASGNPSVLKPLKPSQHRIVLRDGRELQYHSPLRNEATAQSLLDFIPADFSGALEIEIGPGKGEFLASRAAQHPDRFFVGIDRRRDRFKLTQKKLERSTQAANWKILCEDARCFLKAGLPALSVVHVYHPDPWPKARHHKHRFFRSPDAKAWCEALVKGGALRVSTDHREYFEEILEIVHSWGFMQAQLIYKKTHDLGPALTHFEKIFFSKHEPVYKAIFVRS